ncbi:hypothetical protein [Aquitalea pelogenes]|uniref:hypothetical protein n=1 Tax=Aquitalea pelogenes TaxID=1293573 RepID=UPI0035B37872
MPKIKQNKNDSQIIEELANEEEKKKPEVLKDEEGKVIRVVSTSRVINNIPIDEPQPPQRLACLNCTYAKFQKTAADVSCWCKMKFYESYSLMNTLEEDIMLDCDGMYDEPDEDK